MLKNMRLVIFFDMLLIPSFKLSTRFAKTTASNFINLRNLPDKLISVFTF